VCLLAARKRSLLEARFAAPLDMGDRRGHPRIVVRGERVSWRGEPSRSEQSPTPTWLMDYCAAPCHRGLRARFAALVRSFVNVFQKTLDAIAGLLVRRCDGRASIVGKDYLGDIIARSFHQHDVPYVEHCGAGGGVKFDEHCRCRVERGWRRGGLPFVLICAP
jgi:hypothetical protein